MSSISKVTEKRWIKIDVIKAIITLLPVLIIMLNNAIYENLGDNLRLTNAIFQSLIVFLGLVIYTMRFRITNIISVIIRIAFNIYIYYLFKYTLFYFPVFELIFVEAQYRLKDITLYVNLTPFKTILGNVTAFHNWGNALMLFPLGIFLPLISEKYSFKRVLKSGFLITFTIECAQLIFSLIDALYYEDPYLRGTDIDDIILNSLGCTIGYAVSVIVCVPLYRLLEKKINHLRKRTFSIRKTD